jgi:uncharacterized membrane protein YgdD (TMEM256/DUF423 family)
VQFSRWFLTLGAAGCASAVALGAFAAHGLKARIEPASLAIFQTGVTYQFFHGLALCLLALWVRQLGRTIALGDAAAIAGIAFVAGIAMFSFSLYALALGAPRWVGPITPLGGVAFLVGWSAFAWSAWRD